MSIQYDQYLERHRNNVKKAFEWMKQNLHDLLHDSDWVECHARLAQHDRSKYSLEEYSAYDAYFYGGNRSFKVTQDFQKAWLHHIHHNPHHWQHWVLINDDPNEGEVCLKMPAKYVIEMICDWWSFSWDKGDLKEIFKWYDEHKDHIRFHEMTKTMVEFLLKRMKEILDEEEKS